jgi:CARDB.
LHERFDADGNLVWSRSTPESISPYVPSTLALAADDGSFIFVNSTTGSSDWKLISMTSDGYFEPDCNPSTDQPDLTISNLLGDEFGLPGEVSSFTFDLNNNTSIPVTDAYVIEAYISTDQTLSADDLVVGEIPTGNTGIGTIADIPGALTVPDLPQGNYYLILRIDVNNQIAESDEGNNISVAFPFFIGASSSATRASNSNASLESLEEIRLYPNPTYREVFVEANKFAGKTSTIQIYNQWGKVMQESNLESIPMEPIRFDVGTYPPGIYLLRVATEGRKAETIRFIVQRL